MGGSDYQWPLTGSIVRVLVAFLSKQQHRVVVDKQESADGKVATQVLLRDSWVAPCLSFSVLAWGISQVCPVDRRPREVVALPSRDSNGAVPLP